MGTTGIRGMAQFLYRMHVKLKEMLIMTGKSMQRMESVHIEVFYWNFSGLWEIALNDEKRASRRLLKKHWIGH